VWSTPWTTPTSPRPSKSTRRENLIIAGVTNDHPLDARGVLPRGDPRDVCTVYPTLTALDQGCPGPGCRRRRRLDEQVGGRGRPAPHGARRCRHHLDQHDPYRAGPALGISRRREIDPHRRRTDPPLNASAERKKSHDLPHRCSGRRSKPATSSLSSGRPVVGEATTGDARRCRFHSSSRASR
jgi:hypothetical protein